MSSASLSQPHPDAIAMFSGILERYSEIYAIVSPPRCSSTAFARMFWEQPSVRYYCHEPFETTYYLAEGLEEVRDKFAEPLDLTSLDRVEVGAAADALVVKEMPYQAGSNFPLLAAIARKPIIFLMRDPRLSIASRMRKKVEVGDDPDFPKIESGWQLWENQIKWCEEQGIEHVLVDSGDFREQPLQVFKRVFERLGLPFNPQMLEWQAQPQVELDNLGGRHRHLYNAVLSSTGIRAEPARAPDLLDFPREDGWREHVERCLEIYRNRRETPARIMPPPNENQAT